jgi:glycerol uptake facilitator-like aquaporin
MSTKNTPPDRARRLVAEFLGTAALLTAVVGSGIMGDTLAGGNVAIALLANTFATTATLMVLIFVLGPISGAHFNPAVTLSMAVRGRAAWGEVAPYVASQIAGGVVGVVVAHLMFGEPVIALSTHARSGAAQAFSEFIATFGLLAVIWGVGRLPATAAPVCVAAYIAGAYWFTASTSFANPAVTLARTLTDTFAGIRPMDAPAFIVAQIIGALAATALFAWLIPDSEDA